VGDAAQAAGLGDDAAFHCRMAVDEACTNIIEHAYGGDDQGIIEVTCEIEPGICSIEIVDHGRPFNPETVPQPKPNANLKDIEPGGIGLHLMRQMMDSVEFQFGEGRNRLVMVKKRKDGVTTPDKPGIPSHEAQPGVWVVAPEGRLDAATSPPLDEALASLLSQERIWIVVDMTGVNYISSRGLKTLVSAWRKAGDAGGALILFGLSDRVASIFETVGFTHIFDLYPAVKDALAAISVQKGS
jgi:anti-anti-sigma factor